MAGGGNDRDRRAERLKAVTELLRDAPLPAEPADPKSRWINADKKKPDPRSVY